jgi:transposase InsO family protein
MDTGLCLEALKQALETTGRGPGIFNTDQGSQFTAAEWTGRLTELGVNISMDGRGRWLDNVFIERLRRSVKPGFRSWDGVGSVGQAFQPAGAGDFPVARHGTGKFREPADKNVCPTSI